MNNSASSITPAIVRQAATWFIEFRSDDVDERAQERFIQWLRRSPEHIQAYLEVCGAWAHLPETDTDGRIDVQALIARARAESNVVSLSDEAPSDTAPVSSERVAEPQRARAPQRALYLTAAACIFGAIGLSAWLWWQRGEIYTTGTAEQRIIQLGDGTRIELNARSSVRVRLTDRQRDVDLRQGQALFQVASDPGRPFVVHTDTAQIRALGTQFDVYRNSTGTVVTVLEGRVETTQVTNTAPPSPLVLSAGQQVTVAPVKPPKATHADVIAATAWTEHRLVFEETPLAAVAEEFNRYNTRRLIIDGADLQALKISGIYSSTDPASLLKFLHRQPGLTVRESAHEIHISHQ